ncbi:MAG: peroxiredoxin [Oscillatoriales cyanobacterium SM2_2_1]|nr:peroxiredoxin [Oscillatoriales cyanobacterium SM2_2_1]
MDECTCLRVGMAAPDFEAIAVVDLEFRRLRFSRFRRDRHVVLLFYPLDFTFVCPTELAAFSDRHDEFDHLNTRILGISVDSHYAHLAWLQTPRTEGGIWGLAFPLVSDVTKGISRAYNVLDPAAGVALRGLFIIDPAGIVQHVTVNHLPFGRSVDETLRTLRAIQHTQAFIDEGCPVDWQEGEQTVHLGRSPASLETFD